MNRQTIRTAAVTIALAGAAHSSATPAGAQQPPAVRPMGSIVARAKEPFGSMLSVRVLSDGRLLVDDGTNRRLLLLDSTLTTLRVVLDTNTSAARTYVQAGPLIRFLGDSTLFLDVRATSLLLIDPGGSIARA